MDAAETRTVTYLAPGTVPDLTPPTPLLDPKLAEMRDAEIKANEVDIEPRAEPTIDPRLVEARNAEIKRLSGEPDKSDEAPATKRVSSRTKK
jgi:hypothetical protein